MKAQLTSYADLARVHGFPVTASMSMLGALSSTGGLGLSTAMRLVIIGFFTHTSLNALNELKDMTIDSQIPESSGKPLVSGTISVQGARQFIVIDCFLLFCLLVLLFPRPHVIVAFLLSYIWLYWYCCGVGKRVSYSFDISFAAGYSLYSLFGTLAAGSPLVYTWILMGAMVSISLFSQWGNGLKDVDADRMSGVKSTAVMWNVSSTGPLESTSTFFLYGIAVKAFLVVFAFLAWTVHPAPLFLLFIMGYGIPSQVYLLRRFLRDRSRLELRKTMLYDALLMWFLLCSIPLGSAGALPLLYLTMFLITGYLVASRFESGAEWKFGRYSSPKKIIN